MRSRISALDREIRWAVVVELQITLYSLDPMVLTKELQLPLAQ